MCGSIGNGDDDSASIGAAANIAKARADIAPLMVLLGATATRGKQSSPDPAAAIIIPRLAQPAYSFASLATSATHAAYAEVCVRSANSKIRL